MLVIGGTLLALFLVGKFWTYIKDYFLNGALRDLIECIFGADNIDWYVRFVNWVDDVATASIRVAEEWYERFKCNVLKVDSVYTPSAARRGSYINRRESIIAIDSDKVRHVITEETIPHHALPAQARHEMIRQRTDSAILDEKEVVCAKFYEAKKKLELATVG